MATIGSLVVSLQADMAKFQSDMGAAAYAAEQASKKIEDSLGQAQKIAKGLAMTFVAGWSVEGLYSMIHGAIEGQAALKQMSEATGATVEGLSALRSVAKLSGTEMGMVTAGLQQLARQMATIDNEGGKAALALQAIGLSGAKLRAEKPDQAMLEIAQALSKFEDGMGKVAVAQALFGKAGAELLPMLNDLADRGNIVGKVTAQQAEAADRLEKQLVVLNGQSKAFANDLASFVVPKLNDFLEQLIKGKQIAGSFGEAIRLFGVGINPLNSIGENLREASAYLEKLQGQKAKIEGSPFLSWMPQSAPILAGINREIDDTIKKIEFLKLQQKQEALHGLDGLNGRTDAHDLGPVTKSPLEFSTTPPIQLDLDVSRQVEERTRQMLTWESEAYNLGDKLKRGWDEQDAAARRALQIMPESQRRMLDQFDQVDKRVGDEKARLDDMFGKGQIDSGTYAAALGKVTAAAEAHKAVLKGVAEQQAILNSTWQHGAKQALQAYVDQLNDVASASRSAFTKAFTGMEDALVNFVKTGKLDFKSLADSIISDLIRIQVQQSIIKPAASLINDAIKLKGANDGMSFFSAVGSILGFAGGGDPPVGVPSIVGENGPELFVPKQAGTVIPNNAFGGGNTVVNVIESPGNGGKVGQRQQGSTNVIDVYVEQFKAAVAADIMRGGGLVSSAIEGTYGTNRVARAF